MRIVITGHRPNKLGNDYAGTSPLMQKITTHLQHIIDLYQPTEGYTGMALGIDQLWCSLLLRNSIDVFACIPFKGQENAWPSTSIRAYHLLLRQVKRIIIVDTGKVCHSYNEYIQETHTAYSALKMQIRNQWMVQQIIPSVDKLVGVWDGTSGGTANCINFARSQGLIETKDILVLNPNNLPDL